MAVSIHVTTFPNVSHVRHSSSYHLQQQREVINYSRVIAFVSGHKDCE